MVYSVFYYAGEAIARAVTSLVLKLYGRMAGKPVVEEKPKEEKPPSWGWFEATTPFGREYRFVGRYTNLRISVPDLINMPRFIESHGGYPHERLFFTYSEVASKEWFKEIEALAELLRKQRVAGATE